MLKDTIDWLISVEDSSRAYYEKAAVVFSDDKDLSGLLKSLAADEKKHFELVSDAGKRLKEHVTAPPALVTVDVEIKEQINNYLAAAARKLESGVMTKDELVDSITAIEYSECNEIFAYVVNTLREKPEEFFDATANIDRHMGSIESFISSRPELARFLERTRRIPKVSERHILVVDDDKGMLDMYEIFFSKDGIVHKAQNGAEAMKMLDAQSFSAVISDVDMPVMNGLEFYGKAVEKYPYLRNRFLFLTGSYNVECIMFFKKNNLANYMKPVSLKEIRKVLSNIVHS